MKKSIKKGLEQVTIASGTFVSQLNGKFHNPDGPAIIYPSGSKAWYQNGCRHRTDGPAVERADGSKEYWINGKQLTQLEAFVLIKAKCNEKSN